MIREIENDFTNKLFFAGLLNSVRIVSIYYLSSYFFNFFLLSIANNSQNNVHLWFYLILYSSLIQRLYGLVLNAENGHGQIRISPGSSGFVSSANSPAKSFKKSALESADFNKSGNVSPINKILKEKMSKTLNDNKTRNKLTILGILPFESKNRKQSL